MLGRPVRQAYHFSNNSSAKVAGFRQITSTAAFTISFTVLRLFLGTCIFSGYGKPNSQSPQFHQLRASGSSHIKNGLTRIFINLPVDSEMVFQVRNHVAAKLLRSAPITYPAYGLSRPLYSPIVCVTCLIILMSWYGSDFVGFTSNLQ